MNQKLADSWWVGLVHATETRPTHCASKHVFKLRSCSLYHEYSITQIKASQEQIENNKLPHSAQGHGRLALLPLLEPL